VVALSLDLGVQLGGVGASLVPALVQVRGETSMPLEGGLGPAITCPAVAARMNLRTVLGDRPSIVQIWL